LNGIVNQKLIGFICLKNYQFLNRALNQILDLFYLRQIEQFIHLIYWL
jgi:hypothetical protein